MLGADPDPVLAAHHRHGVAVGVAADLVWKLSRFARNIEEGLVYRAHLRKRGIDILSYKEPVPEGPLGSLITHNLMAVDEFYAAATAADVLRSQKELARQGFSAGGRPPVGYRREPVVIGARYDGTPLTRVRWVPDPETAPKVVQAFQMAAEGVTYDEIVAATSICENKSSLATILANPIYRGVRVFNREARVEGEHGRKRRRNPAEDVVTSEVEAVVPEQLWTTLQEMLVRRRKDRVAPQRYAGGYVLTELLRCACGSPMVGTSNRSYRYYRCKARCDRQSVRANDLDAGVMDLIRRTLVTPKAVRAFARLCMITVGPLDVIIPTRWCFTVECDGPRRWAAAFSEPAGMTAATTASSRSVAIPTAAPRRALTPVAALRPTTHPGPRWDLVGC